jgi:ABC-type transport system substrate-binding protein
MSSVSGERWRAIRVLLVTVTAVMLAAAVAACGDGGSGGSSAGGSTDAGTPPATATGTLRVAIAGEPQTLDPTQMTNVYDVPISTALYDGLLTRAQDDFERLAPALATSWKSNEDATKWTFKLRRGVRFSDGAVFDATAAKKSLEYYQRPQSIFVFAVGPISEITTPDDSTLVVSYDRPFPDLARNMLLVKILSPKLLAGDARTAARRVATQAAGTGPYVLDSFSPSAGLVAHANKDYWGDGPHIETIELRPIGEESARNAALQSGDVDLVTGVSPRPAESLSTDPRLSVATISSWATMGLSLATQKPALKDVRVRQALAYSIDREAIAEKVLLGHATAADSTMPPGTYGYRKPETQYTYDPAKARALLAEAGVREPVHLKMVAYTSNSIGQDIGQAMVQQAKAGGFDIEFTMVPDAIGLGELYQPQRRYDIHILLAGWVNGGPYFISNGLLSGQANYRGRKLLDLEAKANGTADGPEREQAIGDAQEEMAKSLPAFTLFVLKLSDASVATLKNHLPAQDSYLPNWSEQYLADK